MDKKIGIEFGDEIEPVEFYADGKKRKFIFMSWMGNNLAGYARIVTVLCKGEGHDEQGVWVKNLGLVLQHDKFVHKSKIKKKVVEEKDVSGQEGFVYAYMCLVDWQYEAPFNMTGNRIFYDIESLKRSLPCVEDCGIVKVKVSFVEVIQEGVEV